MNLTRSLGLASLLTLGALTHPGLSQSGDSECNFPNILAPLYEFGREGAESGSFRSPAGLAAGPGDLLYVADQGNHRVEILAMNGRSRGSFGGCGRRDSEFLFPTSVAAAPDGEVFVTDATGRIQAFSAEGRFQRVWSGFRSARGIAATRDRIFVSEAETHQIRVFPRGEGKATAFGGLGSEPGKFNSPTGIAVDEHGAIYVADTGNHRIQKLDPNGVPLAQWGAWGAQAGLLSFPAGLGYSRGRLYVADQGNHRVQVFDGNGRFLRQWGAAPNQPGQSAGRFHYPLGLTVTSSGGLTAVSEPLDNRIQVFINRDQAMGARVNDLPWWDNLHARYHSIRLAPPPPGTHPQIAGTLPSWDVHAVFFFDVSSSGMGPLVTAGGYGRKLGELNGVAGVAVDSKRDRAYVSDPGNRRLVSFGLPRDRVRSELFNNRIRVIATCAVEKLIPDPPPGYSPELALPGPLAVDGEGRLYMLDRANSAIVVCEPEFKFVRLIRPLPPLQDFTLGPDGRIYATDPLSFQVHVYGADGGLLESWGRRDPKSSEGFLLPYGITLDSAGFVYVTDALSDCVKKFDPQGKLVKIWGERGDQFGWLCSPRSLNFYPPNHLIIEDFGNHRAEMCDTEGKWLGTYVAGGLATPLAIR